MKLEINELYHNYIIRMVIFALFLYRSDYRKFDTYKTNVSNFLTKRVPWKIDLYLDRDIKTTYEERFIIIEELISGNKSDYMNLLEVHVKTPIKEVKMVIDFRKKDEYEKYLYD